MATTLLSDLLWSLACELADRRRDYWATEGDDGDNELRRIIVAAMNQHGWAPDGVPGLEAHVWRLHESGAICLRSVFNHLPPLEISDLKANPANWYLSLENAGALRRRLLPPVEPVGPAEPEFRDELDGQEHPHKAQIERQVAFKRSEGRYTLEEAATELSKGAGVQPKPMLLKLIHAVETGALPTYGPGLVDRYHYGKDGNHVRDFYEEVYWNDLNSWLDTHESRVAFRFPAPAPAPADAAQTAVQSASTLVSELSAKHHWITRNRVMALFPVKADPEENFRFWNSKLDGPPKWLLPARALTGKRGISSLWCPVFLAVCLLGDKRKSHMSASQLDRVMHKHFPELWDEWERRRDYCK